jgi:hypothetical protein
MEVFIMAEINELKKNVEEGELKDEALDGAAGGTSFFSTETENYRKTKPSTRAQVRSAIEKRENC